MPPSLQRELAAAIPGACLKMLAGGNHFDLLTRRDEVLSKLKGCLEGLR